MSRVIADLCSARLGSAPILTDAHAPRQLLSALICAICAADRYFLSMSSRKMLSSAPAEPHHMSAGHRIEHVQSHGQAYSRRRLPSSLTALSSRRCGPPTSCSPAPSLGDRGRGLTSPPPGSTFLTPDCTRRWCFDQPSSRRPLSAAPNCLTSMASQPAIPSSSCLCQLPSSHPPPRFDWLELRREPD